MNPMQILLFVAFIILVVYFLSRTRYLGKAIIALMNDYPPPVHYELMTRRMPSHYKQILLKNDQYYRELPLNLQKSFNSRMMKFIASKDFQAREGLHMDVEMIIMISAAAIKITFGMRNYILPNFHTIIVYPGEFFSRTSRQMSKGETRGAGIIVFSWNDFQHGNSIPNDSINLGYHEFAHALFLSHVLSPYEDDFKQQYREWLVFLNNNSILAKVKNKHIFRDYAAVNEVEFFAVALENFFENPEHFKKELPKTYALMANILNQDLTIKREDDIYE
jgi:hypothetical protein